MLPDLDLYRRFKALEREIEFLKTFDVPKHNQVFLPTVPYLSTSYDGDDNIGVGTVTIQTGADFGLGIPPPKAVLVWLRGQWAVASASSSGALRYVGGVYSFAVIYALVANIPVSIQAWVPCNVDGDFDLVISGATMNSCIMRICGILR